MRSEEIRLRQGRLKPIDILAHCPNPSLADDDRRTVEPIDIQGFLKEIHQKMICNRQRQRLECPQKPVVVNVDKSWKLVDAQNDSLISPLATSIPYHFRL